MQSLVWTKGESCHWFESEADWLISCCHSGFFFLLLQQRPLVRMASCGTHCLAVLSLFQMLWCGQWWLVVIVSCAEIDNCTFISFLFCSSLSLSLSLSPSLPPVPPFFSPHSPHLTLSLPSLAGFWHGSNQGIIHISLSANHWTILTVLWCLWHTRFFPCM